jgi:DMSO/TMAO reductase YedYZ molybdopterin-dependent catalytic subunit
MRLENDLLTRRGFVTRLATGASAPALLALASSQVEEPWPHRLIVRNDRPLNAETPVELFDRFITPTEAFFVRSHFGPPATALALWRLSIAGEVEKPLDLSLEDLGRSEAATIVAVLQCAGNGRGLFQPTIPGVPWLRGAVGNASWSGPRLAELLRRAKPKAGAAHVHIYGVDAPPHPRTPAFLRSIPIEKVLDESTLLATMMNGEPLPGLHGGPVRLVVPGWTGNHWVKWVRALVVARDEAPGFYQQTGYRIPRAPVPPGTNPPAADLVPVTVMNVKSLIARPSRGAVLRPGKIEVQGVAWTGLGTVERVEMSLGEGGWVPTLLEEPSQQYAWRLWHASINLLPGNYKLRARATDSSGEVQPVKSPWNKSGYLWNGIDEVDFEVRA